MISVVICQRNDNDWYVDTWLMSCRVLGRRVEEAILRELLSEARRRRIDRIIGAYRPTARNKMVENHYAKLGFSMMKTGDDGTVLWELDVAGRPAKDRPIPITVERFGFDLVEAD
jgi:predicted enzyme involved in methoxymalonyl-ACP biosynthesis